MRSKSKVALCLLLAMAANNLCRADGAQGQADSSASLAQMSLEQLGNVEVTTASKEPEEVWKTPAAICVITQEDIRRSGATSIPEALRLAPGVEVARIDSDHWAVGIRGFGGEFSKSLLVMIDGRSVYTPLFAGVYWQLQDTLLEDVDRIEVIRGPGGTIWGANAVNGVINIITKSAKDTHGALASLSGGNVDEGTGEYRYGATGSVSGGNLLGRWQRQLSQGSDIQLQAYYDRTTRYSAQLGEIRDTFDIDFLHHLTLKWAQDFLWGLGARWSPDDILQHFATLDFEPHQETDKIYSWFLQDEIPLWSKNVSLTLGSKFEHNNYTGFEVQPNGRLLWTLGPHRTAWAAITRAVRTPSRLDDDLQLTDFLSANPPIFLRVVGNQNFQSEELLGSEIGYRTLVAGHLYLDVATFYNDYHDLYGYGTGTVLVEATPPPARLVLQLPLVNALEGDTAGVEIAPDWKPRAWWELRGSYSYLHLHVHDRPGFTDALNTVSDNGSSPHHQIELQSLLNLPKKFEFDATYRYVSALPAQTVAAYSTGDVRFGWHARRDWESSIVGQNLLQPRHAEFGSDVDTIVGIKRAVYGQIVWRRAGN